MFTFPIIQDRLFFEMTPLIPTREYSNDSGSFMPYAQVRFSEIKDNGIELDLYAFVTSPEVSGEDDFILTDDLIAVSMNLNPLLSNTVLTFICNSSDHCLLLKDGDVQKEYPCERRSGEDERGVYWSVKISLPATFLDQYFGVTTLYGIDSVLCNAYKAKLNHPHKHFGAVASFKKSYDLTSPENLVEFQVINM